MQWLLDTLGVSKEIDVGEDEDVIVETPVTELLRSLRNQLRETPILEEEFDVGEDETVIVETPVTEFLRRLRNQLRETAVSEEDAPELMAPIELLFSTPPEEIVVNASDEANYLTVTLDKPLGIEFLENDESVGGGVRTGEILPRSSAQKQLVKPGYQLVFACGVPVHGLQLIQALEPIIEEKGVVRLTFFTGTAREIYGESGPSAAWLSNFTQRLKREELARALREKRGSWTSALSILADIQASDQPPETEDFASVISTFEEDGRWAEALRLLGEMPTLLCPFRSS